ncbi:hypothetical protein GKIL_3004 [Gloeobacter kilaueensis JS1]|uniref:Uncharacterized protein n=1 Tax=Gloeobacter kilaueensis (strain ATCC BAA-2537 / CCAP 1431/1 / ULC 316 / JS1) TaxID=1183438 RepID=U5QNK0_GLOK1|nr:hypothetical protein GKIL_3004 [Gloeobacter kilaueensis JS1]
MMDANKLKSALEAAQIREEALLETENIQLTINSDMNKSAQANAETSIYILMY